MAIPDFQTLLRPTLALGKNQVVKLRDAVESLADSFNLTSDEREELQPSGRQGLFYNRVAWARFHLVKAGAAETRVRGTYVATADGRRLLEQYPDRLSVGILREHAPSYADDASIGGGAVSNIHVAQVDDTSSVTSATPNEQLKYAFNLLRAKLKEDLRERIVGAGHRRFEKLIRDLLVAMNYGVDMDADSGRTGGPDGGIDGVIRQDELGLDRIYLQAKLYPERQIGRPVVQTFLGSLVGHGASKGVFVTMSGFSREAVLFAGNLRERIELIDGDRLCDLLIKYGVGVRDDERFVTHQIDSSYFSDDE